MTDDIKFRTPNWDIPMDIHFGTIGNTDIPDAMDGPDDDDEELPISEDVISILGFNPEEEGNDEDTVDSIQSEKS
jgi:hypothetical protein